MKKTLMLLFLLFAFPCVAEECDFIQYNTCQSCDLPYSFPVGSEEACSFLCPERVVNYYGSGSGITQKNCALEKCPSEFPFQSKFGSCYKTQKEANNDTGYSDKDSVFDKPSFDTAFPPQEPINGTCPENFVLYGSKCRSCNDPSDWSANGKNDQESCLLCKNRIHKAYKKWGVNQCENTCPKENHFKRLDGKCFSCDYPKAIRVETHCNIEGDCDDICPNRTIIKSMGGNVPSVINCPPDKPMMDDEGICYSCDAPIAIGVRWNPDFCQRFCPNKRHLKNDVLCVLNDS